MQTSECIAFWGVVVTALGVLLTAVFSFLVYKATKVSADATKATFELSKILSETDIEKKMP